MIDFGYMLLLDFWKTLSEMSVYLLFGFLAAGGLSVLISPAAVERHLGGRGLIPIVKASLFGVPLPLCSCGVIPVSMSLYKHGASKGSTLSFLLSTPQTGVDSILVTYSLLGPVFAIVRPLAAFLTGLIGGGLASVLEGEKKSHAPAGRRCDGECCAAKKSGSRIGRAFRYGFVTLPEDIGRAMLAGLAIAALISAFVPEDFFAVYLAAGGGIAAMLVMMLLGIPVYVCATASVPVAVALIDKGLSPGAALVFLMTGPATNAAAFMTLWSTLGRKIAILYLAVVAGCALGAGLLLDRFLTGQDISQVLHAHQWMLPSWLGHLSAVVLLAVLGAGCWRKTVGHKSADSGPDRSTGQSM